MRFFSIAIAGTDDASMLRWQERRRWLAKHAYCYAAVMTMHYASTQAVNTGYGPKNGKMGRSVH